MLITVREADVSWIVVGTLPTRGPLGHGVVYLAFDERRGWYWSPFEDGKAACIDGSGDRALEVARKCVKPWYYRPRIKSIAPVTNHDNRESYPGEELVRARLTEAR